MPKRGPGKGDLGGGDGPGETRASLPRLEFGLRSGRPGGQPALAVTICVSVNLFPVGRAGMEVVLPSRGRWEDYRGPAQAAPGRGAHAVSLTPPPTPRAHRLCSARFSPHSDLPSRTLSVVGSLRCARGRIHRLQGRGPRVPMGPRGPRGTRAAQEPRAGSQRRGGTGCPLLCCKCCGALGPEGRAGRRGSRGNPGLRAEGWSPRVQVRDLAARWRQAGSDSDSPSLWRPGFSDLRALRLHRCVWHTSCCPLLRAWALNSWHSSEAGVS